MLSTDLDSSSQHIHQSLPLQVLRERLFFHLVPVSVEHPTAICVLRISDFPGFIVPDNSNKTNVARERTKEDLRFAEGPDSVHARVPVYTACECQSGNMSTTRINTEAYWDSLLHVIHHGL